VDAYHVQPYDGYWTLGSVLLGRWNSINTAILKQHLLAWLIKGFFLPLMFIYFFNDLSRFSQRDLTHLINFQQYFDTIYDACYFLDVGLCVLGYLCTFRLTATHVRSAEPTASGWFSALVCYMPFWSLINSQYLQYGGMSWGKWLSGTPTVYECWGVMILILTVIYVWATLSFGARFSNLTHRGIITNGPYRWTKHPAYIAKNLSWWFISVPFMVEGDIFFRIRQSLLLIGLNAIYYTRAKTEERHLSQDPTYVLYSQWIEENGLFRFLKTKR